MEITEQPAFAPEQQGSILALAHTAEEYDGVSPLNEEATLAISHGTGRHLLAQDDGHLVGYAYADDADSAAQIVVDPSHRRQGIATHLVAHLAHPDLWAFGNVEPAQYFCASQGYTPVRGILMMERQTTVDCGDPDCARITTFVPSDLDDLVELNARSFADHPEQGQMTIDDFTARMESDWFDPEGLLIARDEHGTMIGFHWTKVEDGVGEVYVLGVDPHHAGSGLGTRLLDAGLTYLASRNVSTVRLWVDDDNHIAQSLYMKSGFSPIRHDIRYRRTDEDGRRSYE